MVLHPAGSSTNSQVSFSNRAFAAAFHFVGYSLTKAFLDVSGSLILISVQISSWLPFCHVSDVKYQKNISISTAATKIIDTSGLFWMPSFVRNYRTRIRDDSACNLGCLCTVSAQKALDKPACTESQKECTEKICAHFWNVRTFVVADFFWPFSLFPSITEMSTCSVVIAVMSALNVRLRLGNRATIC